MKKEKVQLLRNNFYMLKILYMASRWRLLLECLFNVSRGVVQTLIYTVLFGNIVKSLEHGDSFRNIAIFIGVIAIVTGILLLFETWFMDVYVKYDNYRIQKYLMTSVFNQASKVDIKQYEDPVFYDKYVRTLEEANNRCIQLSAKVGDFVGVIATAGFLFSIIISVDHYIIGLSILPIITSYFFGKKKNKYDYELYMKNTKPNRKTEYVNRVMYLGQYAKDIRVSNIFHCLQKMYSDNMDEVISNYKNYSLRSSLCKFAMDAISDNFINICILIYISYRIVVSKTLSIGDYLIVQNAVTSMTWRIQSIINSLVQFEQFGMYIENFKVFMNTKTTTEIQQSDKKIDRNHTVIEFKNVSFSYQEDQKVLDHIDLTIHKGEKVAIVGHNGAGKSTLVKLLLRLYDTSEGKILFNGLDIKQYNLEDYRKAFSTIFQDFCLYAFNIGENVATRSIEDKEEDFIKAALTRSDMLERINKLEHGIKTSITKEFDENGFTPSGGEGQKIAIARAIYRESDVFIMDEPSSALDPIAEARINELMMSSSIDKTVLLISHRLSSTMKADKIFLLDEGKVVECGTHAELMKQNGFYADMFMKQAENYQLQNNNESSIDGGMNR